MIFWFLYWFQIFQRSVWVHPPFWSTSLLRPGKGYAIYDFFCLFIVMFPDQSLTQESIRQAVCSDITFSFIYLAHPRSVTGISWRKTSKYMPRGAVANMLVTSCSGKKSKMILCFRYWNPTIFLALDSFILEND